MALISHVLSDTRPHEIDRHINRQLVFPCLLFVSVLTALTAVCPADESASPQRGLTASSCFVRLKEHASIPARGDGVVTEIRVSPGDKVTSGELIATLDQKEAELAVQMAEADLAIAKEKAERSVQVDIAEAEAEETARLLDQAATELDLAEQLATSDIAERQAASEEELAREELDRALVSKNKFRPSFSQLEIARLEASVTKSRLNSEQALFDREMQTRRVDIRTSAKEQISAALKRLRLQVTDAETDHRVATLSRQRMQSSANAARQKLNNRKLVSPIDGIIAEQFRQRGEWVTAGETVFRVIRLDVLHVEGFFDAAYIDQSATGAEVIVEGDTRQGVVSVHGRLVFVSPEIDSVNGQVKVKAEIRNPDLRLRPGQPVVMRLSDATL